MRKVRRGDNNNKRTSRPRLRLRYPKKAKRHGKLRKYDGTNLTIWSRVSATFIYAKGEDNVRFIVKYVEVKK
jgi:hypothetical protein